MSHFYSGLLGSLVGSGIAVGIAALLNYRYSKKLEAFRWLHKKRAMVLIKLYRQLSEIEGLCDLAEYHQLGNSFEAAEDALQKAETVFTDFVNLSKQNEVLLGGNFAASLHYLQHNYGSLIGVEGYVPLSRISEGTVAETTTRLKRNIYPILTEVRHTIWEMLGVD